ncbi:hypothetical protein [Pedobacter sp. SYSU D00535]|uniref:hypothetical protein n=1 Tax=Pedobacter sp. SYSU D00535 TaxID=2810308 RepID=UPI001A978C93|nr:hypothetical protein [Pedobacter sp. SYSU D00535]
MEYILFRAVTQTEYDDIIAQGYRFRCTERTLEAKQFAISEECGHYYGREIVMKIDRVPYILLRVVININSVCKEIMRLDDCDAVSIDMRVLNEFNDAILRIDPINMN